MDNMNKLSHWMPGEHVNGVYCGVPFAGKLTAYTRPTPDYKNVIFDVLLDAPITVFGMQKASVEVLSNHATNTISAA